MNKQTKIFASLSVSSMILLSAAGCQKVIKVDKPVVSTAVAGNKVQETAPVKRNIVIKEKVIESPSDYLNSKLKYPVISGLEDKTVEDKLNTMFEDKSVKFKEAIEEEAKSSYEESLKDKSMEFRKYEVETDYTATYNKNDMISIKALYYQYTGGAHGGTNQVGYNINLKTGETLLLSQLFEKDFDYKGTIINEILATMKQDGQGYFEDAVKIVKEIDENRPFYLENGNLVIYFGQYEIAPYAAGIPEFKIPFSKLRFKADLKLE